MNQLAENHIYSSAQATKPATSWPTDYFFGGNACDKLEDSGIIPTVRGGDGQHPDPVVQRVAYKRVTEALGHGRISVIGAYAGSITPPSAAKRKKEQQRIERQLAIQDLQAE